MVVLSIHNFSLECFISAHIAPNGLSLAWRLQENSNILITFFTFQSENFPRRFPKNSWKTIPSDYFVDTLSFSKWYVWAEKPPGQLKFAKRYQEYFNRQQFNFWLWHQKISTGFCKKSSYQADSGYFIDSPTRKFFIRITGTIKAMNLVSG